MQSLEERKEDQPQVHGGGAVFDVRPAGVPGQSLKVFRDWELTIYPSCLFMQIEPSHHMACH